MTNDFQRQSLYSVELERIDWTSLRDVRVVADESFISSDYVPDAIRGLINAVDRDEAERQYWRLENHIVVQGQTFEAAEYLLPVLIASLTDSRPQYSRKLVLELIFQMVAYEPHLYEVSHGNENLTEKCRLKTREGLWKLYEIFLEGDDEESESARIILEKVELEKNRLVAFVSARNQTNHK